MLKDYAYFILNVMTDNNNVDEIHVEVTDGEKPVYEELHKFDDLEIYEEILRGVYAMGFEYPSAIQRLAIRPMLDKYDLNSFKALFSTPI